ncbi:MAG TPA: hypothetical protein VJZ69_03225 [Clostridia bacterium]|nr:hypothetical protein [Clostridia bacterium]
MTSKRKLIISIFALAIIIVIFFGSVTLCSYAIPKKAIIILPGLFASGLYNTETGKMVWDPFDGLEEIAFSDLMQNGDINLQGVLNLLGEECVGKELGRLMDNDNYGASDSIFNNIAMNEDGTPKVPTVKPVPWNSESRLRYGVVNAQKGMQETLEAEYGSEYDVQVFNYDFRADSRVNGRLLEEYINAQGYSEVILVSHSNGGEVAATFLGRSQENRNKVSKYISYDSPYLGAFAALGTLENLDNMVEGVVQALNDAGNPLGLADDVQQIFDNQFKQVANMWTVYQLLPSYDLLKLNYGGESFKIFVDDVEQVFNSEQELYEFYCSRPWAKMSNGELRPPMVEWLDYINSMKVTMPDGTKVHSTTLVDTTYFSGKGINSVNQIYFKTQGDSFVEEKEKNVFSLDSDGTVLLASATAGVTDSSKIVSLEYADHYAFVTAYDEIAAQKTIELINKSRPWYDLLWNF